MFSSHLYGNKWEIKDSDCSRFFGIAIGWRERDDIAIWRCVRGGGSRRPEIKTMGVAALGLCHRKHHGISGLLFEGASEYTDRWRRAWNTRLFTQTSSR
jgi:hypothetical protein